MKKPDTGCPVFGSSGVVPIQDPGRRLDLTTEVGTLAPQVDHSS
jgi:hypothetical protein